MTQKRVLLVLILCTLAVIPTQGVIAQSAPAYRMIDLTPNIDRLVQSTAADAYFVVSITGTNDFVQLYGSNGVAYLNFPMVTDRQKSLRSELESVCEELGLTVTINKSASGLEFLDYELPRSATEIGKLVSTLLIRVYSVSEDDSLEFESNGFELTAA